VLAGIGILPPLLLLGTSNEAMTGVWSFLYRSRAEPPPMWLALTQAEPLGLAWAVFFGIMAIVVARGTGPETPTDNEEESESDGTGPEFTGPEPEVPPAASRSSIQGADKTTAVRRTPEADAWCSRGGRMLGVGRFQDAVYCYDKALKLNPQVATAWASRGLACEALGRDQDAIACYDESLGLDPQNPAVWSSKGNCLCASGELDEALRCFNEALVLDRGDAKAWHNKGICLAGLGRLGDAMSCCDRALEIDPSYAAAQRAKAVLEERLTRTTRTQEPERPSQPLAEEVSESELALLGVA